MKEAITASGVVRDYLRRNISPDKTEKVTHGLLLIWICANDYVCELRLGATSTEREGGEISITSKSAYINTYSAQEIADDMLKSNPHLPTNRV